MQPVSHKRDIDRPHYALCGLGYPWPSTIALREGWNMVTCQACKIIGNHANIAKTVYDETHFDPE